MSGGKILDKIKMELRDHSSGSRHVIYLDVFDNSLSRKWLAALNLLLEQEYHLEKNFCFLGFVDSDRDGPYLLEQINESIQAINQSKIGYIIDDYFEMSNTISDDPGLGWGTCRNIVHEKLNRLHRYFEDLQGVSGKMSPYYLSADPVIRWHIRQLNLLCHEFESWALSYRKQIEAPDWTCPSQLMCWLNAPRFKLDDNDLDLFGIETLDRDMGSIYLGVNKAVGKHHWEVFNDEGRDSRINELTTSTLKSQTEAAGDFDIEWGRSVRDFKWRQDELREFESWLTDNGFDPQDPSLTIGHPKIGQVDLLESFHSENPADIWKCLNTHLDVTKISTSDSSASYDYHWSDRDFVDRQIAIIQKG